MSITCVKAVCWWRRPQGFLQREGDRVATTSSQITTTLRVLGQQKQIRKYIWAVKWDLWCFFMFSMVGRAVRAVLVERREKITALGLLSKCFQRGEKKGCRWNLSTLHVAHWMKRVLSIRTLRTLSGRFTKQKVQPTITPQWVIYLPCGLPMAWKQALRWSYWLSSATQGHS